MLEAKDTVIKDPSNLEWTEEPTDKYAADFSFVDDYKYEVQRICEAQAKISFKAGIEEAQNRLHSEEVPGIAEEALDEARKAGIKEVVEWINGLIIGIEGCKFEERLNGDKGCIVLDMNENQWKEQIKKWGDRG